MAAPLSYNEISPPTTAAGIPANADVVLHPLAKMRGKCRAAARLSDDTLTTYMSQIRRAEVLAPEVQNELGRAFVKDGDAEAGKALIWSNLRLVINIARKYHHSGQDLMDLIQEGNLGLSEALARFDPDKGTPFVGYAQFWIRAMILNHLLNLSYPVRLGSSRDSRKLFFNLRKARRTLATRNIEPTAENVAQYLDVDPDEVDRVGTIVDGGVVQLDAPCFGEESGVSGIDFMVSENIDPDEEVSQRLFRSNLHRLAEEFVETLDDERRVKIWHERILSLEPRYLKDLGADFGVSKERVRQLEMDVRRRFRTFLKKNMDAEELKSLFND